MILMLGCLFIKVLYYTKYGGTNFFIAFCALSEAKGRDIKMNVKDFIKMIKKKPQVFVHEVRADYLEYVIEGFMCCNSMYKRTDNEEKCFHSHFVNWLVEWINKNLDNKYRMKSFYWHQILRDVTNDEQEAVDLFFQLCDLYFQQYEKENAE